MIRRLVETLIGEEALRELRETMFPQPPERSETRPGGAPPPASRPASRLREAPRVDEEARAVEYDRRRASAERRVADPAIRRRATPALARNLFRDPVLLRQAILAREILGPPKALQEEGEQDLPGM